jgi:hypothetical protein
MKITPKNKLTKFFESSVDSADKDDIDLIIKTSLQKGNPSENKEINTKPSTTEPTFQDSFEFKFHGRKPNSKK